MPYDPSKTTSLIQTASLHTRMPNAEFIEELTKQLKEAERFADEAAAEVRAANTSLGIVKSDLKTETIQHRNTRQMLAHLNQALQQIASGAKNAKKLATEALTPTPVKKPDVEQTPAAD